MVLNLFLQVFDTGRLTDSKGNEVDFSNTVFVLTSNIGTGLYGRSVVGYTSKGKVDGLDNRIVVSKNEMMKEIKNNLPPEFINRIDEIIFFNPLGKKEIQEIFDLNFNLIKERMYKDRRLNLVISEDAAEMIIENGFSPEFGARLLGRTLRTYLLDSLSKYLIENSPPKESTIQIIREGNVLNFRSSQPTQ